MPTGHRRLPAAHALLLLLSFTGPVFSTAFCALCPLDYWCRFTMILGGVLRVPRTLSSGSRSGRLIVLLCGMLRQGDPLVLRADSLRRLLRDMCLISLS